MIRFGTGGWREVIGDGFTRENVRRIVSALCDRMAREGVSERGVVVGYDRRFLSREAAEWAVEVFAGNDVPVTLIARPAPTPMFMWTVRDKGCAYGLAVTASHNPALYNGLKIFTEGGRDAEIEVTDAIADAANRLSEPDIRSTPFEEAVAAGTVTLQTSLNWYIDAILAQLDTEAIRHRHLSVVLDPMFGVAQTCLQTILMTARCQVEVINSRHDALFGGRMPSPSEATLDSLRQTVRELNADIGIAPAAAHRRRARAAEDGAADARRDEAAVLLDSHRRPEAQVRRRERARPLVRREGLVAVPVEHLHAARRGRRRARPARLPRYRW